MIREFIDQLAGKKPTEKGMEELGLFAVISHAVDTMQNTISRLKLATYSPDILIDIPKNACYFYEFDRANELIELGRQRAKEALADRKLKGYAGSLLSAALSLITTPRVFTG